MIKIIILNRNYNIYHGHHNINNIYIFHYNHHHHLLCNNNNNFFFFFIINMTNYKAYHKIYILITKIIFIY